MQPKTYKANGFVDRIAYRWSRFPPPEKTRICPLFWRSFFSFFFIWPFVLLFFIPAFFISRRPSVFLSDRTPSGYTYDKMVPYKHWWKVKSMDNVRVAPLFILVMLGLVALVVRFGPIAFWRTVAFFVWLWTSHWVFFLLLAVLLGYAFVKLLDTEAFDLTVNYIKAKTDKWCPEVTFEGRYPQAQACEEPAE